MSLCILNRFTVNTNGGNLIKNVLFRDTTRLLVISNCLSMKWKFASWMKQSHSSSFSFTSTNIISLLSSRKKSEHIRKLHLYVFWENKGIMLQTLRGKQKYQVTNVGVEKIKLSRLLVQRINEFKTNEIQRKTPQ